jgi:hypothetical protein
MWTQLDLFPELLEKHFKGDVIVIGTGALTAGSLHLLTLLHLNALAMNQHHMERERLRFECLELPTLHFWPRIAIIEDFPEMRRGLREALEEITFFSAPMPFESVQLYLKPGGYSESGLSSQAPGYASPRMSAKMLRREAFKPRGSKGR